LSTTLTQAPEPTVRAALRSPKLLRTEVLAGLVVALALIPEAISFSITAVNPGYANVTCVEGTTRYR
jgi:SulP family sulfate permease